MNKIFFTGSTGFIGSRLLKKMLENPENSFICLVMESDTKRVISKRVKYIDNSYLSNFSNYLNDCDIVLHLAAELDSKKPEIKKVNVDFTKNLLKYCDRNKLKKFVFFSSVTVTRGHGTMYSESKKEAEAIVKNTGLPYLIIRPSWVIGKGSRSFENFIAYLKKFPVIPIIGNGKTLTQPIFIEDLTDILEKIIFNENEKDKVIGIGGSKAISYNEFISILLKKIGVRKIKAHLPIWLCRLIAKHTGMLSFDAINDFENDTKVDNSYLKKAYGFKPLEMREVINKIII